MLGTTHAPPPDQLAHHAPRCAELLAPIPTTRPESATAGARLGSAGLPPAAVALADELAHCLTGGTPAERIAGTVLHHPDCLAVLDAAAAQTIAGRRLSDVDLDPLLGRVLRRHCPPHPAEATTDHVVVLLPATTGAYPLSVATPGTASTTARHLAVYTVDGTGPTYRVVAVHPRHGASYTAQMTPAVRDGAVTALVRPACIAGGTCVVALAQAGQR